MKKIINFRLTLTLMVCMMVATAFATYVFVSEKSKLISFFICLSVCALFVVVTILFKKKFLAVLSACFLFAALPFISLFAKSKALNENLIFESETLEIEGKVFGHHKLTTSGNLEIILDDVIVDGSAKLDGKIALYTNAENLDLSKLVPGEIISVKTTLNVYTLDSEISKSLSYLNRDIVASGYTLFYNISFTGESDKTLRDVVCNKVYSILQKENLEYADVGYAMLFGDSNVLDTNLKNDFRATGIAHLLAVSGLHVSIIVLMFNFILKKLNVSFKFNLLLSFIFLGFYCYLCNFSVSVIRASLMALFSLYAVIRGKAYDSLSILSLVAILIMLISPTNMFNISFVLSFSAVLSIVLLAKPVSRLLSKVFYKKLADTLSISISVQIGLFVTNLFYFGKYPILGFFANLIAVPIATTGFMILIASVIISMFLPFMSFLSHGFDFLMSIVVRFNSWISRIGFDLRAGSVPVVSILVVFALMFVLSDYVFAKKKNKWIASLSLIAICGVLFLI